MSNYTRDPPKEVSLPLRLPLVGIPNQRDSSPDKDSRLINGYVEVGQDEVLRIVKRPGLTLLYTLDGYGAGLFEDYSFFYVASGGEWLGKIYQDGTFLTNIGSHVDNYPDPPCSLLLLQSRPNRAGGHNCNLPRSGQHLDLQQ